MPSSVAYFVIKNTSILSHTNMPAFIFSSNVTLFLNKAGSGFYIKLAIEFSVPFNETFYDGQIL